MKTNPIGVRFDEDILALIKKEQNLSSPQMVVNYLMNNYVMRNSLALKQEINVKPKETIEVKKVLTLEERIIMAEEKERLKK
jgi:hypothetical protein